ncbi:hypothetical protein H4219_005404 [Mycoemilia scoparia]|uniref:Uncharacterized protein n=1 Tax=Mycoemilia scoparia TaxID=417184 RepID=A0A9W8DPK9_9FUNG|nr:hypothetical protein H4219_005404 [Mycoemilia scoparia]
MAIQINSLETFVAHHLNETSTHLDKLIKSDQDTADSIEYLFEVAKCQDKVDPASHAEITQVCDQLFTRHSSTNNRHQIGGLKPVNAKIKEYLTQHQEFIRAKVSLWDGRYSKFIKTDEGDGEDFGQFLTFGPSDADMVYELFKEKVEQDLADYDDKGKQYVKDGTEFADYLLKIVKFSRTTMSLVGVCYIALERYDDGDYDGYQSLLDEFYVLETVQELENYGKDADEW